MKGLSWCSGLFFLALIGCSEPPDTIVAEVGEYPITASSARNFVAGLQPTDRTTLAGDEARRHYLQILVDGRLLVLEGRNRGIDTTQAVEKAVRKAVNEKVRAEFRSTLPAAAPITEAEVRQHFEQEGFDRKREVARIVTSDRASLNAVLEKLESGQRFEEVARGHSVDENTAQRGGRLGRVGGARLARLRIPVDLFKSLADGEVSGPIPAVGSAWQVIRFTDTVPVEFSEFAESIAKKMNTERQLEALEKHLEVLASTYHARLDDDGLTEMMEAYRAGDAGVLAESPLFHHDGGMVTVADANGAITELGLRRAFARRAPAEGVARVRVLYPHLIELEAAKAGLFDTAEIGDFRSEKRDEVIAEEVRRLALEEIELTEEEIRQSYDGNPGVFRIEAYVHLAELLLPSAATAAEMRERIVAGEEISELADQSLRRDAQRVNAHFHFHRQDRQVVPKLMAAVDAASEGVLTGPVAVEGGYSVFRVLERVPAATTPYAEARQRARTLALRQRQGQAFHELLLRLREKYATQAVVHSEELTAALPDSILQSQRSVARTHVIQ